MNDASVFFLRAILHDWPDDECVQILKILREAATPETRLIISGFIIAYACPGAAGADEPRPPEPLLFNGGHANAFDYMIDMQVRFCLIFIFGSGDVRGIHAGLIDAGSCKRTGEDTETT